MYLFVKTILYDYECFVYEIFLWNRKHKRSKCIT